MNNSGEIVLPCSVLDDTLSFFIEKIGFRLESIFPADEPREAVITGFGLRLRLKKNGTGVPGVIHLYREYSETISDDQTVLVAPHGTQIKMIPSAGAMGGKKKQEWIKKTRQLQEGGLVTETGMAMLHETIPKPEYATNNSKKSSKRKKYFPRACFLLRGHWIKWRLLDAIRSNIINPCEENSNRES